MICRKGGVDGIPQDRFTLAPGTAVGASRRCERSGAAIGDASLLLSVSRRSRFVGEMERPLILAQVDWPL